MFSLKEIWLKNFRSYKDLHLKDINNLGLTLIQGKNGSGKSSIRLAIEYLLTDNMPEDISVDEYSYNKQGNCELGCVLQKESDTIRIIKYRDHKTNGNKTILEVNGNSENYTENDRRQTQKNIEKLLGVTREELSISSIFSQESLSFPKCKESERKKILYDALNLHKYTEKHEKIKEKIKDVQKEIDDIIIKYEYTENAIQDSLIKIENLKESSKVWEDGRVSEIENMRNDILEIQARETYNIKLLNKEKVDIEQKIIEYQKYLIELEKSIFEIPEHIYIDYENIKNKCTKLEIEISNLENNIYLFSNKSDTKELKRKINERNKIIDDLKSKLIPVNTKERQAINENFEEIKNNRTRLSFEISNTKKELSKVGDGICPVLNEPCKKYKDKSEEIRKQFEDKLNYILNEYNKFDKDFKIVEKLISQNKDIDYNNSIINDKIKSGRTEIKYIEKLFEKAISEDKEKQDNLDSINKQLADKSIELNESNNKLEKLQVLKYDMDNKKECNTETGNRIARTTELITANKMELQLKEELITRAIQDEELKEKQIEKINKAINSKIKESNPYTKILTQEDNYFSTKWKEKESLLVYKEKLNDDLKYWNFLKVAYSKSGIPNMKMEVALEIIEIETNKILSEISDRMYVRIGSQGLTKSGEVREKISYEIYHPEKKVTNFWSYSGGERQRIEIASIFAFNTIFSKINIIILDEVLELSLDESGKKDIITLLKNKAKNTETILCISHDDSIKDSFNSIINIKKENEESMVFMK